MSNICIMCWELIFLYKRTSSFLRGKCFAFSQCYGCIAPLGIKNETKSIAQIHNKYYPPSAVLGLVQSMLQLNLKAIMYMKTSPSFAFSYICRQKRLFTRRKIQLISDMFYFIWKASFLQEHNNDLLIYKVLYFRGSQNTFHTIMIPCISNLSNASLEHKICLQRS